MITPKLLTCLGLIALLGTAGCCRTTSTCQRICCAPAVVRTAPVAAPCCPAPVAVPACPAPPPVVAPIVPR